MSAPTRDAPPAPPVGATATVTGGLRIAHFSDTYLPRRDGVNSSLRTLTAALGAAGHECLTVVPRHPAQPDHPDVLALPALPCGIAGLRLLPRPTEAQVRRIAGWRPDVIHVHTPGPVGLLGMLAARRLGLPVLHTYHTDLHAYVDAYRIPATAVRLAVSLYARRLGVPPPQTSRTGGARADAGARTSLDAGTGVGARTDAGRCAVDAANQLLLRDADAVVVPTPAVLDRVGLPVPAQRLFLVPAAVPQRAVGPNRAAAFRQRHGVAATDRMVLFVGRVNREKGIDLLIPAFARVVAAQPTTRLVLVGAVYERRWLRRLIDDSGVADRIVVTGELPADQVAAAYASAEVFAFPSRTDTQGLVLQEAALAGVPCVLADPALHRTGALAGTAVLAEASTSDFAAAVTDLLRDPAAARRVGAAARTAALRHTPERYARAMLDVYAHVLA